jgi:mRNA interferase MazF
MTYHKNFEEWSALKSRLNDGAVPTFKEREVWWCSVGVNIGYEIDGKNELFNRPVLILRKTSKETFFGLPLTSKEKSFPWGVPITLKQKTSFVAVGQLRFFDAKRLNELYGKASEGEFEKIKKAVRTALLL